jgi:hypothetical protein
MAIVPLLEDELTQNPIGKSMLGATGSTSVQTPAVVGEG